MTLNLILAYLGVALMVALSGIGSIYGLAICGNTVVGSLKKRPEAMGTYILLSALPSTQGIYGFVGYFLIASYLTPGLTLVQGVALFFAGLILGGVALISAIKQGQVCANGIAATASGHNVTAGTMIMAAFPEFYAILALLVVILISGAIGAPVVA